jgi:hypothetical protein
MADFGQESSSCGWLLVQHTDTYSKYVSLNFTLDHSPSRLAVAEDRRRHQRDAAGGWEGDIQ